MILIWIDRNVPGLGILVLKFDLMAHYRITMTVEDDEARGGGPLVYTADKPVLRLLLLCFGDTLWEVLFISRARTLDLRVTFWVFRHSCFSVFVLAG